MSGEPETFGSEAVSRSERIFEERDADVPGDWGGDCDGDCGGDCDVDNIGELLVLEIS